MKTKRQATTMMKEPCLDVTGLLGPGDLARVRYQSYFFTNEDDCHETVKVPCDTLVLVIRRSTTVRSEAMCLSGLGTFFCSFEMLTKDEERE